MVFVGLMGRDRSGLLQARADWVGVLESLYAPVGDDASWARPILDAFNAVFQRADGVGLFVWTHDTNLKTIEAGKSFTTGRAQSMVMRPDAILSFESELVDAFFNPPALANTHTELGQSLSPSGKAAFSKMQRAIDVVEVIGLVGRPEPGTIAVLAASVDRKTILSRHERRLLTELTLHLESAVRLRSRPRDIRAILTPDGAVVHRESGPASTALAARTREIEASRTRRRRRDPDAIALWNALVAGEVSVVEQYDGPRRQYAVLENAPSRRSNRSLTQREIETVRMASRGLPQKLIAYGLGLSPGAVSNALGQAAAKLGLRSRLELLNLASLLTDTARAPVDPASLTATEREIFELVRRGLSNEEIARRRARSVRTVANQVASILQKTDSPSRRAIASSKLAPRGIKGDSSRSA